MMSLMKLFDKESEKEASKMPRHTIRTKVLKNEGLFLHRVAVDSKGQKKKRAKTFFLHPDAADSSFWLPKDDEDDEEGSEHECDEFDEATATDEDEITFLRELVVWRD